MNEDYEFFRIQMRVKREDGTFFMADKEVPFGPTTTKEKRREYIEGLVKRAIITLEKNKLI